MEEDRLQTDIGIAADIEEAQLMAQASHPAATETQATQNGETPMKQPKKRFVGRRAATEAAAKNGGTGESGAVQSTFPGRLTCSPSGSASVNV